MEKASLNNKQTTIQTKIFSLFIQNFKASLNKPTTSNNIIMEKSTKPVLNYFHYIFLFKKEKKNIIPCGPTFSKSEQ